MLSEEKNKAVTRAKTVTCLKRATVLDAMLNELSENENSLTIRLSFY